MSRCLAQHGIKVGNRVTPIIEARILELHAQGLLNKEIAAVLDLQKDTIGYRLKKNGLKANGDLQHRKVLIITGDGLAVCPQCGEPRPPAEFENHRSGKRRLRCTHCETLRVRTWTNMSAERLLRHSYSVLMARARRQGHVVTIVPDDITNLWDATKGKCFYTDIPMEIGLGKGTSPLTMSIDKIIPERGYTPGNVVLCTRRANAVKNDLSLSEIKAWLPGWHERIVAFQGSSPASSTGSDGGLVHLSTLST